MEQLIADFGYIAVFIGTYLEGETVLALGGVAASYGYLSFWFVVGVAVVGAFLGDQTFFFLGRRYGTRALARFPSLAAKAPRVQALVRRWDAPAVMLLRFCYGLRIAGPIVIGTCGISPWRLAFFNFIGALVWAPLIAGIGYLAGQALEHWIGHVRHVQIVLLMIIMLAGVIWWLALQWRRR
ncbi:MAG TPA: DedA family protein [Burkholderiales bacterium]|nr:DedA family protein [Burkholderiales bacterium]